MKALAVLGMHRSYTSLGARWLSECGVPMGERTLGSGIGNEDGHFEDVDFLEFHQKVLLSNGLPSNGMAELGGPDFDPAVYGELAISRELATEGRTLVERKANGGLGFGWKEPRTCLFLPFYRELLNPFALILFRPAGEVVASLVERERRVLLEKVFPGTRRPRYWLDKKRWNLRFEALELSYFRSWIHYNECLLDHIAKADRDRLMVHDLESLLANDAAVIEGLRKWGFDCQHVPLAELHQIKPDRDPRPIPSELRRSVEAVSQRFAELIGS